jgi:hypothetical protein
MFACKHNHAIVDLDNVVDHVTVLVETTVVECIHRIYFAKDKKLGGNYKMCFSRKKIVEVPI